MIYQNFNKKIYVVLSFLFILSIVCLKIAHSTTKEQTPISDDVQVLLTVPNFDKKWLDNNIYPAFVGLYYDKKDYVNIGQDIIEGNYNNFKEWLETDRIIKIREGSYSIFDYSDNLWRIEDRYNSTWPIIISFGQNLNEDLFEVIKKERKTTSPLRVGITQSYKVNKKIIKRHQQLLKLGSHFKMIPYYITHASNRILKDQNPSESYYYTLSLLSMAEGLSLIIDGKVKAGLDLIEYEYDLAKKVYLESNDLEYSSIYLQQIDLIYFIINYLLDSGAVDKHLKHSIFAKVQQPLFTDFKYQKWLVSQLQETLFLRLQQHYILLFKEVNFPIDGISYPWGYYASQKIDKGATLNLLYEYYQMIIENVHKGETVRGISPEFQGKLDKWLVHNEKFKIGELDIFKMDKRLTNTVIDSDIYANYINFFKSVINNQKLLIIKIKVQSNKITSENMETYLTTLGELNFDELEQLPFEYQRGENRLFSKYYQLSFMGYNDEPDIISVSLK